MAIVKMCFQTQLEEMAWVSSQIKKLVQSGEEMHEIAVISRKHDTLKLILPHLEKLRIPVCYDQELNILENPQIQQILKILQYVDAVLIKPSEVDYLLPEIFSYPFWELQLSTIWKMSLLAYDQRKPWLEVAQNFEDENSVEQEKVRRISKFLLELSILTKTESAEVIIDKVLGVDERYLPEDTQDEDQELSQNDLSQNGLFNSPFRRFYFQRPLNDSISGESRVESADYLSLLTSLRVLTRVVREQAQKNHFKVNDLLHVLELYNKNNISLNDNSPFDQSGSCVNLLTAHKAKGMEFKHVFVVSCQQDEWVGKNRGVKLSFPLNLPLIASPDELDDKLRLLYVAITRAKENLYLSSFDFYENGKESQKLLMIGGEWEVYDNDNAEKEKVLQQDFEYSAKANLSLDLKQKSILKGVLSNYQLSVTHLNNFLDVTSGGPISFLQNNLLRFPQMKSPHACYGTAMHAAMRSFYAMLRHREQVVEVDFLLKEFEQYLHRERLSSSDFDHFLKQGKDNLKRYYELKLPSFDPKSEIERNFKYQDIRLGEARITGQIDKLDRDETNMTIIVTDFKTGKAASSWQSSTDDKVKLWKYNDQLLFYKILVEHSRDYGGKYIVKRGCLEFLEAEKNKDKIELGKDFDNNEEVDRLVRLIEVVYEKIMNMDFPDTSAYEKTSNGLDGIKQFVEDLINRVV